jgi:protein-S-isoprenylcysteine O-methyltransferase Ste14
MYAGAVVLLLGMPLALGSWWGLCTLLLIVSVLVWRLLDEEKLLKKELAGYVEYSQKVQYRLVPYLW